MDAVLKMPEGYEPTYEQLLDAVKAYKLWDLAEENNLGSFSDKMNLCSYAQWAADRALGRAHAKEWTPVPQITLQFKYAD